MPRSRSWVVSVALASHACRLPGSAGSGVSPSDSETGELDDDGSITAADERLQTLACSGELPVYEICPCDVTIDWSHVTADLMGDPVDPSEFETVALALLDEDASAREVRDAICADTYDPSASEVHGYVDVSVEGKTSIVLSEMSFLGTPCGGAEAGSVMWLLWSSSDRPGMGVEMMVLLGVVDGGLSALDVEWPP
jgi:hypothetical protein